MRVPYLFKKEYIGGYIGPMPWTVAEEHGAAYVANQIANPTPKEEREKAATRYYSGRSYDLYGFRPYTTEGRPNLLLASKGLMANLDDYHPRYATIRDRDDIKLILPYDRSTTIGDFYKELETDKESYAALLNSRYQNGLGRPPAEDEMIGLYTRHSYLPQLLNSDNAMAVAHRGHNNPNYKKDRELNLDLANGRKEKKPAQVKK